MSTTTTTTLSVPHSLVKRLLILNYPKPQYVMLEERDEFINVVAYLLEKYIANNEQQQHQLESLLTPNDTWEKSLLSFLKDKHYCQIDRIGDLTTIEQKCILLECLTTQAIKESYKTNADQIHESKYKCLQKMKLQLMSFDSTPEELKTAIIQMATLFRIPIGDSLTQMLHAIVRIAERKFTTADILALRSSSSGIDTPSSTTTTTTTTTITTTTTTTASSSSLNDNSDGEKVNNYIHPLGFDTDNDKMNSVATILRLLYVSDLREIQSKINEVLAIVQNYTAEPQTNFKLGVVGR
ncbi:hypothetical protein SAMD00019534_031030, partial [Acytostelium subglobosum LB1]|uniref:hypothetical protein n=1 Tax=Acytostelium subglobosum LB1 TaxID=1410327 RepID=UPI000644BD42